MHPAYSLGLDYGTNTVRALFVDTRDGREIGSGVASYPHGEAGVIASDRDPHLARQHPEDYRTALVSAVRDAVAAASKDSDFSCERVVGIGIDATASTPIPLDEAGEPLISQERFQDRPEALAWLWKDHTAYGEADELTEAFLAREADQISGIGGRFSSEWLQPKLLRLIRQAPDIAEAAAGWIELGDWVAAFLSGVTEPSKMARNACAAGHKAAYHHELGWPRSEILRSVSPELADWVTARPAAPVQAADTATGALSSGWARTFGLAAGIPIATPLIDAHAGAVGAGVRPGCLAKIIGTSSCDMLVHPITEGEAPPTIPGINGVVSNSILPGHWGIEGGQAAVGDIFGWFVREFGSSHETLTAGAAELRPGSSGLLALDWNNGNRCLLGDTQLSGLLVGQTLRTKPHEVYRSLIESTAFGARLIVDRIVECHVPVEELVVCGGIAEKNELFLQIYADVLERPLELSRAEQTCALGAAIFGAVVAGAAAGGHDSVAAAQQAMTGRKARTFRPDRGAVSVYRELHSLYRDLHDAFGVAAATRDRAGGVDGGGLEHVMKKLLEIRSAVDDRE